MSERQHPPSPTRLRAAHTRGFVPSSAELSTVAAWWGLALGLIVSATSLYRGFEQAFARALHPADTLDWSHTWLRFVRELLSDLALPLGLAALFVAIATAWMIRGLVVPAAQATQPTQPNPLFEWSWSTLRVLVVFVSVWYATRASLFEPRNGSFLTVLQHAVWMICSRLLVSLTVVAIADVVLRRWLHQRALRMSHEERVRESREEQGDPYVRSAMHEQLENPSRTRMHVHNGQDQHVYIEWDEQSDAPPRRVTSLPSDVITHNVCDPQLAENLLRVAVHANVPSTLFARLARWVVHGAPSAHGNEARSEGT